jgi:hypothetical protein
VIDGIAAFVVSGLMAVPFIVTEHWLAGQGPTTPLAWLLDYHRPGRICKETLSGVTESATVADGKTADRGMTRRCILRTCHRPGVRADGTGDRVERMRTG